MAVQAAHIDQRVARMLGIAVGGLFLAAAVGKACRIDAFSATLLFLGQSLRGHHEIALLLAMAIASWEAAIGAYLLVQGRSRGMHRLIAITVLVFSVALVKLWLNPAATSCGCLGGLGSGDPTKDALTGLVRNASLVWIIAWLTRTLPAGAES